MNHPLVTVIVPCRNEIRFISQMLQSLLASTYPRECLEIIFIDGMSTDGTREALSKARSESPCIRIIDNPRLITPVALNLGIKQARGEVIVRMDAHSEYLDDYIERCVRLLLSDPKIGSAGGRIVNVAGSGDPWARAAAYVRGSRLGVGPAAYITSRHAGRVESVAFGTFRRRVLLDVGLFDERLTRCEDSELHARLRKAGYVIAFDPRIAAFYRNRSSLRSLARRSFKDSEWFVYTFLLYPYMWSPRRLVPVAFLSYLALFPVVAALHPWCLPAAAAPLAIYAALVAFCSIGEDARAVGRLRIAATFACHHIAYGAGAFVGVFKAATGRWRFLLGRPVSA